MNVIFSNNTLDPIIVIFGNDTIVIESFDRATVLIPKNGDHEFKLKKTTSSRFEKGHYILSAESLYVCHFENEETIIDITQNKKSVQYNVDLEYLIASINELPCELKKCLINDETGIKKKFRKKERIQFFFIDLIESFPGLAFLLLCLSIGLIYIKGWFFGTVALVLFYCLLLVINYCSKKFIKVLFKKAVNFEDGRKDFYRYFEEDFLLKTCIRDKNE